MKPNILAEFFKQFENLPKEEQKELYHEMELLIAENKKKEDIIKAKDIKTEIECQYCGTMANNATTKKGLYVCCCYMLHKVNDEYTQYHKGKEAEHFTRNG